MAAICKLCDRLILSQSVTFAAGTLTINIPAATYNNGERYCIVVAQAIPAETTVTADVVITIGDGTEEYPLENACCVPVSACLIRSRRRYTVKVVTTATGGVFKLVEKIHCYSGERLAGIDGTAPTEGGAGA